MVTREEQDQINRALIAAGEIAASEKYDIAGGAERAIEKFNSYNFGDEIKRKQKEALDAAGIDYFDPFNTGQSVQGNLSKDIISKQESSSNNAFNVINDFVLKPIQNIINDLFNVNKIDDMTESQKFILTDMDRNIKNTEDKITMLQQQRPKPPVPSGSIQQFKKILDAYNLSVAPFDAKIKILENELKFLKITRENFIRSTSIGQRIDAEVKKAIGEARALTSQSTVTAQIKSQLQNIMNLINEIITRATKDGIGIATATVKEIGLVMNEIKFKIQQPISEIVNNVVPKVEQAGFDLFGIGKQIAEALQSVFFVNEEQILSHELGKLRIQKKLFEAAKAEGLV